MLLRIIRQRGTQSGVCGDAARERDAAHAGVLYRKFELREQAFDDGALEGGADVGERKFAALRFFLFYERYRGGFEAAEAEFDFPAAR